MFPDCLDGGDENFLDKTDWQDIEECSAHLSDYISSLPDDPSGENYYGRIADENRIELISSASEWLALDNNIITQ